MFYTSNPYFSCDFECKNMILVFKEMKECGLDYNIESII